MMSYPPPAGAGNGFGEDDGHRPSPAGPITYPLWDTLIIVHVADRDWSIGVEAPAGHYELLTLLRFQSYSDARKWLINFHMRALE